MVETITRIRNSEPIKPTTFQMGIPGLFETTILKMLAKRPDEQLAHAGDQFVNNKGLGRQRLLAREG